MKEGFTKHATAVFSRTSPQKPLSPTPQRELVKRKGVHFDQQTTFENTPSTSDYVLSEGKEWGYIQSCFGLMKDQSNEHRLKEDAELLQLCNFYESEENPPKLTDDSDEYIPYEVFAEQGMRMSYKPKIAEPTVSSLDLTTVLRIDSRSGIATNQILVTRDEQENFPSTALLEEKESIEMAFQGNLPCTNSQKAQKRRSSLTDKAQKMEKVDEEEDFWSNVEF